MQKSLEHIRDIWYFLSGRESTEKEVDMQVCVERVDGPGALTFMAMPWLSMFRKPFPVQLRGGARVTVLGGSPSIETIRTPVQAEFHLNVDGVVSGMVPFTVLSPVLVCQDDCCLLLTKLQPGEYLILNVSSCDYRRVTPP